ncbi:PKD domain-containing protein [Kitasatospora sp. NPDC048365]|uniref:PKD domain-containing protein n=1 Tax=Kitasatospora sp. NPDC048365 TaxID=3364050 RepID=UPI003721ABF8
MRLRQSAALTVAAVTAVLGLPGLATADQAGTLIVDNDPAAHCSDTGSGTPAQPFCTISAAAKVVEPGQTVRVLSSGAGQYFDDEVHLTRSGTPDRPITFLGGTLGADNSGQPLLRSSTGAGNGSFVLSNVHDVVIKGFQYYSLRNAITIADSSRITVDGNWFDWTTGTADIRLSGASDHITVSRNKFLNSPGVAIDPGVHDTLVTANDFDRTRTAAITAKDAPGTAVTNNTIAFSCMESVLIDGASPGALVENNVITADYPAITQYDTTKCGAGRRGEAEISISADSTAGSKADYNTVHPWPDAAAYRWAGTPYPTAAAFTTATGQGAHDTDLDIAFDENLNWPFHRLSDQDAAAIDSADPTAPGVPTDLSGSKPLDHPSVANPGLRDRGAYERSGLRYAELNFQGTQGTFPVGPTPLTIKFTARAQDDWGTPLTGYTFDFGDGTAPVVSTSPTVEHTYAQPGQFTIGVTVTNALGASATIHRGGVHANPPGDMTADFTSRVLGDGTCALAVSASSPWEIASVTADFGDRTGRQGGSTFQDIYHHYEFPGTYPVTVTVTDTAGHTVTKSRQVQVDFDADHRALLPGERVQVIARSSGPLLSTGANYTAGVWAGFSPVDTSFGAQVPLDRVTAVATATTSDEYLRTFLLADGKIYNGDRNLGVPRFESMPTGARGRWEGWKDLSDASGPGPLTGVTQLAAASIGKQTHLVALAGGRVYEASGSHDSGTWSKWGDITAAVGLPGGVTSIAAGTTGNSLHVATLGADRHVRVADGNYDRGTWSGGDVTAAYGGPTGITQVAGASTPGSRFHVVVLAGGSVYETTGDYAAGYWTGWGNISAASGLSGFSEVAAASTGNSLRLFGVSGGHLYNANGDYTRGQWSKWLDVTAPGAAGTPAKPITGVAAGGIG